MTYEITLFIAIGIDLAQSLVLNKAATHTDMEKYAAHADMIQDATNLCIQNTKQTELLNSWYVQ